MIIFDWEGSLYVINCVITNCSEKKGLELLHTNYAACTNFQSNMTRQLTPTPLNPISALRSQNNTHCLANLVFL